MTVASHIRIAAFTSVVLSWCGCNVENTFDNGIERISLMPDGTAPYRSSRWPTFSANGRYVMFSSNGYLLGPAPNMTLYRYDVDERVLALATADVDGLPVRAFHTMSSITADGRLVMFTSDHQVKPGVDSGLYREHVYVRDMDSGEILVADRNYLDRISEVSSQGGSISADGTVVVFSSESDNMDPDERGENALVFVRDIEAGQTILLPPMEHESAQHFANVAPLLSPDGRTIAYQAGDIGNLNEEPDAPAILILSRWETGAREIVATVAPAVQYSPSTYEFSTDGRWFVYSSQVRAQGDWAGLRIYRLSVDTLEQSELFDGVEGAFGYPSVSADGRFVVFASTAMLDPVQTRESNGDIYVHDTLSGTTALVTRSIVDGDSSIIGGAGKPDISDDGRTIAFASEADDLVADDVNHLSDVFLVENPLYPEP